MKNVGFSASDDDEESGIGPLASLPANVISRIVSMLPATDYAALRCVSRSWRDIVSSIPSAHHRDQLPLLLIPPSYALPDPLLLCRRRRTLGANNPVGPVVRFPCLGDRRILAPPIFPLDVPRDCYRLPSLANRPPRLRRLLLRLARPPRPLLPHLPPQPPHR
uniref:F-box domain-containing protein n=1 Tax=Ananas comosus var. bracteatus TaxID=296719 RepID=A0A6V7PDL0_ANACO|nr:unnamed protein product [Ananas comosus var. bracteatus]